MATTNFMLVVVFLPKCVIMLAIDVAVAFRRQKRRKGFLI